METCCKSSEIYENFECNSFSYSATSNYCQLMEEQTTNKMQENGFYNFYLREPLVKSGVESDTPCYQKRYKVEYTCFVRVVFLNHESCKVMIFVHMIFAYFYDSWCFRRIMGFQSREIHDQDFFSIDDFSIFFVFGSLHLEIYSGTESSENKNTSIASFDLDNTQEAWCLI